MSTQAQAFWAFIGFAPTFIVIMIVFGWAWLGGGKSRPPVKDKLLRAPGESLRQKLEKFDEKGIFYIIGILLYGPVWFMVFTLFAKQRLKSPHVLAEVILFAVIVVIVSVLVALKLIRVLQNHRNYFLGFRGERAVGEELNKLMLDGCLVFHDVPGDAAWNVDHVVVAPSGVYAIETKTRRKGKCPKGKRDYEVIYDGRSLEYPHCRDSHGLDQVKANAKWLSRHLSNALAEEIRVTPILTLPGWLVSNRAKPGSDGLHVLSHKQIRSVIVENRATVLDEKLVKQIGYQLELKCRDVEF